MARPLSPPKNKRKIRLQHSCDDCAYRTEREKLPYKESYCKRDGHFLDDESFLTICDGWKDPWK